MKTAKKIALLCPLALVFSLVTAAADDANASEAPKTSKAESKATKPAKEKEVQVTGSYIKRPVRKDGAITDGSMPLSIIDRDAIDRSGAATLRQALVKTGYGR